MAGRVAVVSLLGLSDRERTCRRPALTPFVPTRAALAERAADGATSDLGRVFRALWTGWLPALWGGAAKDRDLFLSSYLQTYLQRDVRDLAQVGDHAAFLRFLRACAARTGQLLNLTELARDVDVSVPTAGRWLSVLEASFQVMLLRPYHSSATKRLVKTPKLYFLDTGLAAHLTEWSTPEALAAGAMAGAFFETFAFVEILKSWWHRQRSPNLYYYRDRDGREIDLVIEQDGKLHPIEFKRGALPRREWVSHFGALGRLGAVGGGGVVCLCRDLLPLDAGTHAIPVGMI
jgi:uncharacterized protein